MRLQIENPSLSSSAALSSSSSSSSSSSPSPFLELQVKDMDDVTTRLTGTYRARESRDENDNIISHACARHCLDSANFPLPDFICVACKKVSICYANDSGEGYVDIVGSTLANECGHDGHSCHHV